MKNLFTLFFALFLIYSYSQQKHFSLNMALRMQSDSIYCDLIANDDLPIKGFQMGFYHNSDNVEFLLIKQTTLPDLGELDFNEICPKYVRMLWTKKTAGNHNIKKGDVLFSLVYKELSPTDHFICMMPSKGTTGEKCTTFLREAFDDSFNNYIVDDICIDYKIKGQIVVVSSEDVVKDHISVNLNSEYNNLIIQNDDGFLYGKAKFQLNNINGMESMNQNLQPSSYQTIDLSKYPAGMYVYRILEDHKSIKSGKIVLR